MKAQDLLKQIGKQDAIIRNKRFELLQMQSSAEGLTTYGETVMINGVPHNVEKVQSTSNPHSGENAICEYAQAKREILQAITRAQKIKQSIITMIEQLNTTHYEILHMRYVRHMELTDVANAMGQSYDWVTTMQGRAFQRLQKIIDAQGCDFL